MAQSNETNRPAATNEPSTKTTLSSATHPSDRAALRPAKRSEATTPFSFMRRFMDEMDSLFDDFGFGASSLRGSATARGGMGLWAPQIDVTTRDDRFVVHADLPGLRQDDIKVTVQNNVLSISGQRADAHEDNRDGVQRRERSYGSFRREIALPEGVAPDSIDASFDNGVLEVSMPMPKQATPQGRTIPIGTKSSGGREVH